MPWTGVIAEIVPLAACRPPLSFLIAREVTGPAFLQSVGYGVQPLN